MARFELFLLLLFSLSYCLIDPPVMEVHEHNVGIAPQGMLHENVLQVDERTPSVDDPFRFLYLEILTVTPSVNGSVTAKDGMHPQLIWVLAEDHNRTVREVQESGDCYYYERERTYGDMRVENITAYYTVDGLIEKTDDGYRYNVGNETVQLGSNGSITGANPSGVPFMKEDIWCSLMEFLTKTLLGGMINLDCYEPSLARASPYPLGNITFWNRTVEIGKPHLNVSLDGTFSVPYDERVESRYEDGDGHCVSDPTEHNEGNLTLHSSDFATYEIQNDYMALLPFGPNTMNLSGETSDNPLYYFSLLSNSELYKYYSRMDGKTASAYYIHSFEVVNDSYGTQFIVANVIEQDGLLPEDPEYGNNYTGERRLLVNMHGTYLRDVGQFSNVSYNYSRVYAFREVFYNLTPGWHHADFMFYTWWGNYSATSDIHARIATELTLRASTTGTGQVTATCLLKEEDDGLPVSGQSVKITCGGQEQYAYTDGSGACSAIFSVNTTTAFFMADYAGSESYLPSSAVLMSGTGTPFNLGQGLIFNNEMCLLVFAMLLGISFISMASSMGFGAGGMTAGEAFGKFFPFARKPGPGKKAIRVKKGKELAVSAAAAAAGGAGAGSKLAGDAAKKKVEGAAKKPADDKGKKARDKAKKEHEERMKRAMMDEAEKKKGRGRRCLAAYKDERTKKLPAVITKEDFGYEKPIVHTTSRLDGRKYVIPGTPDRLIGEKETLRPFAEQYHRMVIEKYPTATKAPPEFHIVSDSDYEKFFKSVHREQTERMTESELKRMAAAYSPPRDIILIRESNLQHGTQYMQHLLAHEIGHHSCELCVDCPKGFCGIFVEGDAESLRAELLNKYPFNSFIERNYHPLEATNPDHILGKNANEVVKDIMGKEYEVARHSGWEKFEEIFDNKVGPGKFKEIFIEGEYKMGERLKLLRDLKR